MRRDVNMSGKDLIFLLHLIRTRIGFPEAVGAAARRPEKCAEFFFVFCFFVACVLTTDVLSRFSFRGQYICCAETVGSASRVR